MKRTRPAAMLIPAALTLALLAGCYTPPQSVDLAQAWRAQMDAKPPTLIRLYRFDLASENDTVFPNVVGTGGDLGLGVAGQQGRPQLIEGMFPGTKAVRIDTAFLFSEAFPIENKSFTVEAWLRTNGPGSVRGKPITHGGILLSVGNGYWDGWRVTMHHPDRLLGFEIGRPRPSSAIGIEAGPIAEGVWHHVAASWDGSRMRLFCDGLCVCWADYAGAYTPPGPDGQFRIGYAAAGWGTSVLDVAIAAVHGKALSHLEILQSACMGVALDPASAKRFQEAEAALEGGDSAKAGRIFASLARAPLPAPYHAAARIRLGQWELARNRAREAAGWFTLGRYADGVPEGLKAFACAQMLSMVAKGADLPTASYEELLAWKGLSVKDEIAARMSYARHLSAEGRSDLADEQYACLMRMEAMNERERLDLALTIGNSLLKQRQYGAARDTFGKVVADPAAPGHYRSYAQLRIAQAFLKAGDAEGAEAAYAALAAMEGVPAHHRWEASECIAEIQRVQRGLPARDPTASRTAPPARPKPGLILFVAPNGSDDNPGTADLPLATLEGARDAIRRLKERYEFPSGGVEVRLAPGEYPRRAAFVLEARDSGTEHAPIVYRCEKPGRAVMYGGVRLRGFQPVRDPAVLERLPEESRRAVMQADLRALGIADFGVMRPRGIGPTPSPATELFFDDKPMTLARWPNEGFLLTGSVHAQAAAATQQGAVFQCREDRIARWASAPDPWIFGYLQYLWADITLGVAWLDVEQRLVKLAHHGGYGVAENMPYYFFNLLEEIDRPGEWYLDRRSGILYLYPPSDPARAKIEMSMLAEPMVNMQGVSHVAIEGLAFELGRFHGVTMQDCSDCLVAGCAIRKMGGDGVIVSGGRRVGVLSCDIHTMARGGTRIAGGDLRTLEPGGHYVENCHIYDFSRLDRTYTPAVHMDGCGNRIAHNRFHGSPCHAMRVEGNDHIIEFNEIFDVLQETDDQGGLDMWYNPAYRGNVIRYNYWHDMAPKGNVHCGGAGIRLDDAICEVLIYGNVFRRCSSKMFGGVQIHGGKENIIDNNIFADCEIAVSFSPWGKARWKETLKREEIRKKLYENVDITSPPYSVKYPRLAALEENPDVNSVWRNIIYNCGTMLARDQGIQDLMDNLVTTEDPGFVDARGDFNLRPDAPALEAIGFRPIPFSEIGLYKDQWR